MFSSPQSAPLVLDEVFRLLSGSCVGEWMSREQRQSLQMPTDDFRIGNRIDDSIVHPDR